MRPSVGPHGSCTSTHLLTYPYSCCFVSFGVPRSVPGPPVLCLRKGVPGPWGACIQELCAHPILPLLLGAPSALPLVRSHGNQTPSEGHVLALQGPSVCWGCSCRSTLLAIGHSFLIKPPGCHKQNQLLETRYLLRLPLGVISKPPNVLWRPTPSFHVISMFGRPCCSCCYFVRCGVVIFKEKKKGAEQGNAGRRDPRTPEARSGGLFRNRMARSVPGADVHVAAAQSRTWARVRVQTCCFAAVPAQENLRVATPAVRHPVLSPAEEMVYKYQVWAVCARALFSRRPSAQLLGSARSK